jgi:hypothetical protein
VYATISGKSVFIGAVAFTIDAPKSGSITVTGNGNGSWKVSMPVVVPSRVKTVQFATWCRSDQSDIYWYTATKDGSGNNYVATVNPKNHKYHAGKYSIHAYVTNTNGVKAFTAGSSLEVNLSDLVFDPNYAITIMGASNVNANQMAKWYTSKGKTYPAAALGGKGKNGFNGGAANLQTFCQIVLQEAAAEGVKAEVVFAQAMKETGWLGYGGDVKINQFNFAGLGATGGGANGASFDTVRQGIRAQVQHLKAYASKDPLKNACVDPRFQYVTRGSAPYVLWLGQKENPNGVGWATGAGYGTSLTQMVLELCNV